MDAIRTENLTKKYSLGWHKGRLLALEKLTLHVREGEVYGLLGPNGSGKSTTLKCILNLVTPTDGAAWIFDVPCDTVESRLHIGFLPENPYFYKYLTGVETLEFYGRLCGMRGAALRKRIDELIDLVGLARARDRRLSGYSKGMLQRIGLAQAMIHDPRLLLLDEPTAGVDPIGSRDIRDLIVRLKEMGKTVLLSSHLLSQVQDVCDRIGVLNLGKMILEGDVNQLISDQRRLSFTVEGLPEAGRGLIETAVHAAGAKLVNVEHPQTTLESLFLAAVKKDERGRAIMTEHVGFSFGRVWTIAGNTFTESVRQKVYNILLIFALVVIASASFFAQFSFGDIAQAASYELKSIKDTCFGALSVIGMLIAVVGTGMLLPNELENRTIYTILSKPVRRFEFLLGKYLGTVILTFVSVILMSLMFMAEILFKEMRLVKEARAEAPATATAEDLQKIEIQVAKIRSEAYDMDIGKGILLIFVKLSLLAAITMFVSTFSTLMVFNVAVTLLVFFAGHMVGTAKDAWHQHTYAVYLLSIFPDLGMFNVTDDIIVGSSIPWSYVAKVTTYGVIYLSCVLGAAHLIF